MAKITIGSIILHLTETNPYDRKTINPYRLGTPRVLALKQFMETGKLPWGVEAWNDRDKVLIKSPDEVDWSHMTD